MRPAISSRLSCVIPSDNHPIANDTSFELGSCVVVNVRNLILVGIADASPTKRASCLGSDESIFVIPDRLSGKNRATCSWSELLLNRRTTHELH